MSATATTSSTVSKLPPRPPAPKLGALRHSVSSSKLVKTSQRLLDIDGNKVLKTATPPPVVATAFDEGESTFGRSGRSHATGGRKGAAAMPTSRIMDEFQKEVELDAAELILESYLAEIEVRFF
jgi:hypothetical protein